VSDVKEKPFSRDDVGAWIGVNGETITRYRSRYRSTHPFPEPAGYFGKSPFWHEHQKADVLKWDEKRLGQGAGGGRPWDSPEERGAKKQAEKVKVREDADYKKKKAALRSEVAAAHRLEEAARKAVRDAQEKVKAAREKAQKLAEERKHAA
jgi:hypothetical protein